ncbi:hypothetical protein ACM43_07315 [Bradyrhizobium sp. CCBAU 45321]|uniref:DUF3325 domain-containing protein n=1 Tax=Bradyrhizobium TaxID=374 RepID=UPI002302D57B|nr:MULTISPECIES: DUF3325 domain-containing protein [Bradyrhizobium]MDA9544364.1 hypothetical protein [Bradyrhizobium sp. CCBAU 45321]MDF0578285.1 DUF3325 domain-containing protein [Bradyrhizobium yuanmingense]
MIHLLALGLCLGGFAALAFATHRQQRDIFGTALPRVTTYGLRAVGAGVLLLALGILVAAKSWSMGLVMFSGHTTMAAAIVFCALIGWGRLAARTPRRGRNDARVRSVTRR